MGCRAGESADAQAEWPQKLPCVRSLYNFSQADKLKLLKSESEEQKWADIIPSVFLYHRGFVTSSR